MNQKVIKVYRGVKNVIAISFKNNNERLVNASNCEIEFVLMDLEGIEIFSTKVNHTDPKAATITIPTWVFQTIEPQYLKYSLYQVSYGVKTPVYLDTQYGVVGVMQLEAGQFYQKPNYKEVTTFLASKSLGVVKYTSEAIELFSITNQLATTTSIKFIINCNKLDGVINIQVSDNAVISTASNWELIDSFSVTETTSMTQKSYSFLTKDIEDKKWARVVYVPTINTSGKISSFRISTGI